MMPCRTNRQRRAAGNPAGLRARVIPVDRRGQKGKTVPPGHEVVITVRPDRLQVLLIRHAAIYHHGRAGLGPDPLFEAVQHLGDRGAVLPVAVKDFVRPGNPRKFGMEMTFLPHARVKSVDWIEPADNKHAVIEISTKGALARSRMHWPVFAGLRPYALRWIRTANEGAETVVRFNLDSEIKGHR